MPKQLLHLLRTAVLILFVFVSRIAMAGGTDNYYIYSNVYGGFEPWYTTTNTEAMNTVFGAGGWFQDFFETCDPATVFSSNTNFVFLEGSDGFADELETFLFTNGALIESWVNAGGRLFLNAAPNEGDGMSYGFGGVTLTYWGGSGDVTAVDPSHPIFNGPYTPVGTHFTGSSFSHASVSGGGVTPLIADTYTPTTVAFAEEKYGTDGLVGFGGMTTNNFHSPLLEAANLRANIIYYLAFYVFPDHDIASISMESPSNGCGIGVEDVTVTFKNYGLNDESNVPVSYQLDGGTIVTDIITGPITAGSTFSHTFSTPADLTALGTHTVVAWPSLATDEDLTNDTITKSVDNIPTIASFPYYEDFEAGASGWTSGGASSTWELGNPVGFAIVGPPPATPGSLNSWTTDLAGYYNNNEKSYVTSPCLDFSSLVFPYLEMDINWDTQTYSDGAKVQYSLDAGATWTDLGNVGTGTNWYTGTFCYGMWPDFYVTDYRGWDGNSGGWKHAYQDLSFLGGASSVKIRIVFGSDGYWNFNDGFAFDNFKVADLFPNDVGVAGIAAPSSGPSLTASEPVAVTVKNYGTLPQSGFPVSYKMGAGPVHTETFTGTVDPGATAVYTFATTEDLSADGDYTFTSWTSMVGDEDLSNDTITQVVSNLLPITGSSAYYIYSNTTGGEPWYTTTNSAAMDAVFGPGLWTLGFYETIDPAVVFGTGTCFVFMEGSDAHALELESFLNANITLIQNWVASGGHLFLNAAPNEGDGMDFGFDATHLNYPWYSGSVDADMPLHPVFAGPFTPTATTMTGGSYGHAFVSGTGFINILHDSYNPDHIVCAEKSWGAGTVIFGGMTTTNFHYPSTEADNFRRNIISYLATCTLSDNDMGVQSAYAPTSSCGLSADESISIKVKNYGFLPQTDVPVSYQVNAGPIVTETVPGTIDVGETVDYTFAAGADLSAIGAYNIAAWTSLATDTIYTNDTTNYTVNNVPTISSFPYIQSFETGANGWIPGGSGSTWELGSPAGFAITGAPPTTPTSVNSWTTSLTGYYNNNEKSYVESPCMDFTSLVLPYIEFDVNWDTQTYSDGGKVQYTLDGGATWNDLGNVGDGINWYNSYFCYGMYPTFFLTDYRGWDGNSGGWRHAHLDMSFLAGQPSVRFRFEFGADGYWNYYDGLAFDNVKIQDPFPHDVGVSLAISPASAVSLTATEIVSVELKNYGTSSESGFNVAYQVNGGTVHTEFFAGTIPVAGTAVMTFAATEDFSVDGDYNFVSWTELPTDGDHSNDTLNTIIKNLLPVTGTDAFYIFSNVYGGFEPWYVTSNSSAMDAVFGAGGWYQDYFETLDPAAVFDENTCFVYLEGSDAQASELESFLTTTGDAVENWVSSGGNLLLNSAPNEGDGMNFGFGGVTLTYPYYTSAVTAADPGHPVFSGPFTPITTDYTGSSFGHAYVSGADIEPIIVDTYDNTKYVLAEKGWGDGHVLVGGMTPPYFHSPATEAQDLLQNVYDYLKLCSPVDLGVTALVSPEGGCGMGVEDITITVQNFGPSSVSTFPVKYQINGGAIESEFATVVIPAGGTGTYTFTITYDFTAPGDYDVCVWTAITGDADVTNDMYCVTLTSLETPVVELGPNTTVCDEVTLDAGNTGDTYLWNTGETTQTINVTTTGTYTVTVTNPTSGCAVTDNVTATVNYTPVASFTYTATGLTVVFTNTSTDGASYSWSFGDGGTSTTMNPSHTYAVTGSYTVSLTVTNGCGTDYYSIVVEIGNGVDNIGLASSITVHPNPSSDFANVHIDLAGATPLHIELLNAVGQIVWTAGDATVTSKDFVIDMRNFAAGVYQLQVVCASETASKPIVLTK